MVDTDALTAALASGRLRGAALDVVDPEPLPDDHPLWRQPKALVTSHSANGRAMMHAAYADLVADNIHRFRAGETMLGVIDPERGF